MEKETFGRKMVLFIGSILIIGGVFLFFKYLFPIIAPFVVALLIAVWIEKPVDSISRIFRGKKCLASGIIVFVITAVAVTLIIYVLWFALGEVKAFIKNYDYYIICISQSASGICKNVDMWFGFSDGSSFSALCNMVDRLQVSISDGIDTQVVGKMVSVSVPVVVSVVKIGGYVIVGIMSVIYLSGSLTDIRNWCHNCVFKQEIGVISLELHKLVHVYFKVQGLIMLINSILCVAVLLFINNSYAWILGIFIGIIDALPIFGTGTVLIPWALFELVSGDFFVAAVLVTLYIVTYFVREIMESKLMGTKMGIAPFTMLMVIFVGLLVYGIMGFILGPVSYCIIKALILYLKTIIESGKLD